MIGIAAHQRRQVERDAQPGAAGGDEVLVTLVGFLRRAEPGELAHRPELAAVAGGMNAAHVGKLARVGDLALVVDAGGVVGGVEPLDGASGNGREGPLPLGRLAEGRLEHVPLPAGLARAGRVDNSLHLPLII